MPRTARYAPGGMVYHVLNRGVGKNKLFFKDEDYLAFERVIEETLEKRSLRILSYCLMPNHWHFVLWPRKRWRSWLVHATTHRDARDSMAKALQHGRLWSRVSESVQVVSC